jgi:hypothetical protein
MKKIIFSIIALVCISLNLTGQGLAPYIKIGESSESIEQVSEQVISTLKENSFTVLGTYNPSSKNSLKVIAFTRTDLKNTVIKVSDRGALAAAFKVGLVQKDGKITISYTNPDYFLRAYLLDNYNSFKGTFEKFSTAIKSNSKI